MDQLEKFIKEHRDEFDDKNPDPRLWLAIESNLHPQASRQVNMWRWVAVAAVGLVFVLSGVIAGMYMSSNSFEGSAEYAEFKVAERYYEEQLDEHLTELARYNYDVAVTNDVAELAAVYDELSKELRNETYPDKQRILQAMISNYQTRIDLLKRVLSRLESGHEQIQNEDDEISEM